MVGLAIRDTLSELYDIDSKIKWPNDIFFDHKKFCGVLIETKYENNLLKIVIGIGINVFMHSNEQIDQDWTSLKLIDGEKSFDRNLIIGKLTSKILDYSRTYEKYGFSHFQILILFFHLNLHIKITLQWLMQYIFFRYEPFQVYKEFFFYHDHKKLS